VRDRVRELAVLKAVGYSDKFVLGMILAEALLLALVGGGIGILLAKLLTLNGDPTRGMLPFFYLAPGAAVAGIALALAVGMLGGILPALSAMRLKVVDALRRV
jgi:putative ABC transport system permease protein